MTFHLISTGCPKPQHITDAAPTPIHYPFTPAAYNSKICMTHVRTKLTMAVCADAAVPYTCSPTFLHSTSSRSTDSADSESEEREVSTLTRVCIHIYTAKRGHDATLIHIRVFYTPSFYMVECCQVSRATILSRYFPCRMMTRDFGSGEVIK